MSRAHSRSLSRRCRTCSRSRAQPRSLSRRCHTFSRCCQTSPSWRPHSTPNHQPRSDDSEQCDNAPASLVDIFVQFANLWAVHSAIFYPTSSGNRVSLEIKLVSIALTLHDDVRFMSSQKRVALDVSLDYSRMWKCQLANTRRALRRQTCAIRQYSNEGVTIGCALQHSACTRTISLPSQRRHIEFDRMFRLFRANNVRSRLFNPRRL